MSALAEKTSKVQLLMPLAGIALLGVLVAAVIVYFQSPADSSSDGNNGSGQAAAQSMALNASAAIAGDDAAFDAVSKDRERFVLWLTEDGKSLVHNPNAKQVLVTSQRVLDGRKLSQSAHQAATLTANTVPQLLQGLVNVVSALGSSKVESMSLALKRFEQSGHGLTVELQSLALGLGSASEHSRRASESLDYLNQMLGELRGEDAGLGLARVTSNEGLQRLAALNNQLRDLSEKLRPILSEADQLAVVNAAGHEILLAQQALTQDLLKTAPAGVATNTSSLQLAILGAVAVVLIVMLWLGSTARSVAREARKHGDQNERNQQAILRLLDELSSLADGDLTVQATVSEDITGAIADSINYAIEALRELVTTINSSAITLDASAKQTLASAGHLAKASVAQSKQVAAASESAAQVAASVEEVSGNAERSADVARHAVDIAHKGGEAVRRTISGMNAIRETIQETSKRIKRLGESSQEIGNIVELINDIAEQTNILALNASIQASMAGEAGRGFAVVADEVQRLAERAANATKQIEGLVQAIQADTNEAVISMERSTTDVVGGALLAENAGAALVEIEQVSNQIASLVHNISANARQQTTTSQSIARSMQVLREISAQTAENSAATSNSVGKLAQLSAQLRKSVSGFRLHETLQNTLFHEMRSGTGQFPAMPQAGDQGAPKVQEPRKVGRRA
jgi:twitching motility protein PilJ